MLYTIVYMSYARMDDTEEMLEAILQSSRKNNSQLDITGKLMYGSGTFIQILEGEEEKIRALYAKIELDNRHEGAFVLYEGPLEKRAFAEWSMTFRRLKKDELDQINNKINLKDPQLKNNFGALVALESFNDLI